MPWATVLRNVAFGWSCVARPARSARRRRADVDKVGLSGFEDLDPHQLVRRDAGNESASLQPSRVDADILLMDEPFALVDEQIRRQFFRRTCCGCSARSSKTVIFVTHSIEEAVYVSDQVVIFLLRPLERVEGRRLVWTTAATPTKSCRDPAYLDWVEKVPRTRLRGYLER